MCTVGVKKLCPYRNRTTTVAVATPWKTTRNCVPAPYVVTTYLGLPLRTYGITFNNYEKYRSFHTCRSRYTVHVRALWCWCSYIKRLVLLRCTDAEPEKSGARRRRNQDASAKRRGRAATLRVIEETRTTEDEDARERSNSIFSARHAREIEKT